MPTNPNPSLAHAGDVDRQGLEVFEAALSSCRSDVEHRISKARSTSESEVLAIGKEIDAIVDCAKGYSALMQDRLRLVQETKKTTSEVVHEMMAVVQQQESTVRKAMEESSAILRAGQAVQAMASATRLLSLNARIEAERLGAQGASFSVIADEMRQLSNTVQKTNSDVSNMAMSLEHLLPKISEQSQAIQGYFEQLIKHTKVNMGSLGGDDDGADSDSELVENIMAYALRALSHLAFQDPMAQSLNRIVDAFDGLQAQLERMKVGELRSEDDPSLQDQTTLDEPDVDAGEVLLF